jgi:hypothetical protein
MPSRGDGRLLFHDELLERPQLLDARGGVRGTAARKLQHFLSRAVRDEELALGLAAGWAAARPDDGDVCQFKVTLTYATGRPQAAEEEHRGADRVPCESSGSTRRWRPAMRSTAGAALGWRIQRSRGRPRRPPPPGGQSSSPWGCPPTSMSSPPVRGSPVARAAELRPPRRVRAD